MIISTENKTAPIAPVFFHLKPKDMEEYVNKNATYISACDSLLKKKLYHDTSFAIFHILRKEALVISTILSQFNRSA